MGRMGSTMGRAGLLGLGLLIAGNVHADLLTAERAVQLALRNNSRVIGAEASVLDARSSLYGSYSGIVPRFSASLTRQGAWTKNNVGNSAFGGVVFPTRTTFTDESYATSPTITGSWSVLDLSTFAGWRSASRGLQAARQSRQSIRNDVALAARRQFYEVVGDVRLAQVSDEAVRLARNDERRVRALFEVGSVSRSDLLKAQVRTAQSELDSLTAHQTVTVQRINLAILLGLREESMGEVDTILTAEPISIDEAGLVTEAAKNRPDLMATDAELAAARSGLTSAHMLRAPYVTVGAQATFNSTNSSKFDTPQQDPLTQQEIPGTRVTNNTQSKTDRTIGGRVALNWDFFDALATDSRVAAARARLLRAQDARNALHRNLESEVHEAVLTYREAVAREGVARRALESATENLKLTQEKYNVGSATILDLIDAQVQLQRAQSDVVSALAAIRVAEAQLNRVRGRAQ